MNLTNRYCEWYTKKLKKKHREIFLTFINKHGGCGDPSNYVLVHNKGSLPITLSTRVIDPGCYNLIARSIANTFRGMSDSLIEIIEVDV